MPSSAEPRVKTPVLGAYLEGWRRVVRAPALAASLLVMTLLTALPLGAALGTMLGEHLGSSVVADIPAWNWSEGWAAEFAAQAQGLGRTFTHEIIGFGGTLNILSGILDRQALNPTLAGVAIAYGALWMFLTGGIMDRLARDRAIRTAAFFAACGGYFVRMMRLGVVTALSYWILFKYFHPLLLTRVYDHYTRNMTAERDGLILRVALYLVFTLVLCTFNLIFDYAKVRLVVEDRRSVISALGAAMRFARRRPLRVAGLYFLNSVGFLLVLRLWLEAAPQAWESVAWAFFVTQLYLVARIWLRLTFIASENVYLQGELAHPGNTARPPHLWPNSAAAEAIHNLTKT
jgi:hypothetical protein